jgi:IS5 family transposase
MAQMGFFDLSNRYASLDAKNDPLVEIDAVVPWEGFRPVLERVWRKPDADRKSRAGRKPMDPAPGASRWIPRRAQADGCSAGRKPMDAVLMFKTLVLSAVYNLSDDQIEYQIRDRLSFMRFLGLGLGDRVPPLVVCLANHCRAADAKTVGLYRDTLAQAGKVEALFRQFDGHLARQGCIARGGQILDASIVAVPRNHNTRDENAAIKKGEVPEDWADKPAKRVQKDVDARWTKKHGKSHYGYKNHVNVDRMHKLVRRYHVSPSRDIAVQCPAGQWMQPGTTARRWITD